MQNSKPPAPLTDPAPARAETDPAFQQALAQEGLSRARRFFSGIRAYRAHPARRESPDAPALWQEGSTSLRDYGGAAAAPALLVIPSLINRADILDLYPEQSFMRSIAQRGWRALAVDWGAPGQEEAGFTLDHYMARLLKILDIARRLSEGRPIPIAGYCMGGLLALALAALRPDAVRSLTLLATPWDFHRPAMPLTLDALQSLDALVDSAGFLPVDAIQTLFAAFQPLHTLKKFAGFARLDSASGAARRFVLLEDWLNEGVPLTAGVARDCLQGWYRENRTGNGTWQVLGQTVDPRRLAMPAYIVIPARDRIVPPASARAVAALMPQAALNEPALGHIGLMASQSAPTEVWQKWLNWLDGQP